MSEINFDLNTTDWTQIENLSIGKTYSLQTKKGEVNFKTTNILFTQADKLPTKTNDGHLGSCFKFTKDEKNIYIRTNITPINVNIEKIEGI